MRAEELIIPRALSAALASLVELHNDNKPLHVMFLLRLGTLSKKGPEVSLWS